MYITRKIELWIKEDDKGLRNEIWKIVRDYEHMVFKSANLIVTNQLFNQTFTDRIVLTDKELSVKKEKIERDIDKLNKKLKGEKDDTKKKKIKNNRNKLYRQINQLTIEARKMAEEFYTTSEKNTTYQLIRKEFPTLPSHISASLNDIVTKNYSNEIFEVRLGKRSLRTYRKGIPIPFMKSGMRFEANDDDDILLKWVNDIVFELHFGKDKSNNQIIVEKILKGDYKVGDSSIQLKKGKIFLLLVVDIPEEENQLNDEVSVGVDLGLSIPAVCSLNVGDERLFIGSYNDFIRVRTQLQSRKRRLQRSLTLTKGGKGRGKKLKAFDRLKTKERNFVKTYNHTLTNRIVKFAKDNLASTIKLEFLEGYGENEPDSFVLRNWSYFELQTQLQYKAEREGMEVVFIDPYHTSQTCSFCNHYEKGQRLKQSEFLCKNVDCSNIDNKGENIVINTDWNVSRNIAKSEKFVTKKSDCEYFKLKKDEKN
jgi:IS605 OrfB family transposase